MSDPVLPIVWQPALVEEAVLRAIAGRPEERAFRRARDPLYDLPAGEAREDAFWTLHADWFARLELGRPVHAALAELPLLAAACQRCAVSVASTRKDEGADLHVDARAGAEPVRTITIRLRATAFAAPEPLLGLLRAELLHVADMVDPAFGYEPALPDTDDGPARARLLQDRYRALWKATVAGRLARRGVAGETTAAEAQRAFIAAFPMLGAEAPAAFDRFFSAEAPTHAELVAFATSPRVAEHVERLVPGARCPLCRFPTYAPEPEPERLPEPLVASIHRDFPDWRPALGLCRQCADLYRARAMSLAAAAMLPGAG